MLEKLWLLIRNIAAIILLPCTVTIYIPYQIIYPTSVLRPDSLSVSQYSAMLLLVIGTAILFRSIWSFAHVGKGTLAPFDETKKLVVDGLHRYVRNPMYIGVILMLLAESWFYWSSGLLIYTAICFVVANIMVIGYEENRLKYKYGDEFLQYCTHVNRWVPTKPYGHVD